MQRNKQLDVARGIAILLVLLGHCFYSLEEPLNKVILSFHMPLFFFLSGITSKVVSDTCQLKLEITKKIKTILIPQLTLGIVCYIYQVLFIGIMKHGDYWSVSFIYYLWKYWFLEVLFVVQVIFMLLAYKNRMSSKIYSLIVFFAFILLSFLFIYVIDFPEESPFYINVVPIAFLYFLLGYKMRISGILSFEATSPKMKWRGQSLLLICLLPIVALSNSPVKMFSNSYGNIGLFFASSLVGIYLIWKLAYYFESSTSLSWFGRNSIVVYVWQFVLTAFFKNIAEDLSAKGGLHDPLVNSFICFLFCLLAIVPLVLFSNKYVPIIFGKK